jgi:flagellar assembly factor FliW
MRISTIRFGELEIPEDKIITMAKPVLGFEHLKQYCIIEGEEFEPFLWFQSVEDPAVAFIVVNPLIFHAGYRIEVNPKEIEELHVRDVRNVETYVIVTIPADPEQMSVNLQGPILVNTETCLAKQMVLVNTDYKVRYFVRDIAGRRKDRIEEKEMADSPVA